MTISRKLYTGFGSILGILDTPVRGQLHGEPYRTHREKYRCRRAPEYSKHRKGPLPGDAGRAWTCATTCSAAIHAWNRQKQTTPRCWGLRCVRRAKRHNDDQLRDLYSSIETNQQSWDEEFATPLDRQTPSSGRRPDHGVGPPNRLPATLHEQLGGKKRDGDGRGRARHPEGAGQIGRIGQHFRNYQHASF